MPPLWAVVGVLFAVATAMIGGVAWLVLARTREARPAARAWLDRLAAGDVDGAHALGTAGLRATETPASIAAFARAAGLDRPGRVSWWELSAAPERAILSGRFTAEGRAASLMMVLRPVDGVWRVDSVAVGDAVGRRLTVERDPAAGRPGLRRTP